MMVRSLVVLVAIFSASCAVRRDAGGPAVAKDKSGSPPIGTNKTGSASPRTPPSASQRKFSPEVESIVLQLQSIKKEAIKTVKENVKQANGLASELKSEKRFSWWDLSLISWLKDYLFKDRTQVPQNKPVNHKKGQELATILRSSIDVDGKGSYMKEASYLPIQDPVFRDHVFDLIGYVRRSLKLDGSQSADLLVQLESVNQAVKKSFDLNEFGFPEYIYLGVCLSMLLDLPVPDLSFFEGQTDFLKVVRGDPIVIDTFTLKDIKAYFEKNSSLKEATEVPNQILSYIQLDNHKSLLMPVIDYVDFDGRKYLEAMVYHQYFPIGLSASLMPVDGGGLRPYEFLDHDYIHYNDIHFIPDSLKKARAVLEAVDQLKDRRKIDVFGYFLYEWIHENNSEDPLEWTRRNLFIDGTRNKFFHSERIRSLIQFGFSRESLAQDIQERFDANDYDGGLRIYVHDLLEFIDFVDGVMQKKGFK